MVLVAVATLALGGTAAAVLINRSVERSVREEFARQAEATALLIESEVGVRDRTPGDRPVEATAGLAGILRVVGAVGGHDFVEAAFVTPRGLVESLSDAPSLIGQVPGIASLERAIFFDAEVDGATVTALAQPLRLPTRGTVVVVIGTSLDLLPWADVLVRFLWALALGVFLASMLAGFLSHRAARRLEDLRDASRAVADGDLGARVVVQGDDEVAEVGTAFNEMAAQLDAARMREREFLVSVGHDLRTPLTTITGYAEAIQEGKVSPDDMDRVAAVLGGEADRLRRLVEDLMLLSRIEAREFSLRPESVDLAGHLKGVLEAFRGRADAVRVVLEADLADVGPVVIDPDRIAQVVANLLENALRYTPEAGRVRLEMAATPGGVSITVADTGPGIEEADVPRIFDRLYVTQRYRPLRPEGSGLGLSIVRELVAAMGGTTHVVSAPGEGTRISVEVPLSPTPART